MVSYDFLFYNSYFLTNRGLCDIDMDGRLSNNKFRLVMHLYDLVRTGEKLPNVLP